METRSTQKTDGSRQVRIASARQAMEETIRAYSETSQSYATPVPGLQVARITQPIPPSVHISEASLCILVRGSRKLSIAEVVFAQDEDTFLLSTVGLPSIVSLPDASPSKPYTALRVELDLELARQIAARIEAETQAREPTQSFLYTGQIEPELLEAVARLVLLIDTPNDIAYMSDLIHREILYRLLSGRAGDRFRNLIRLGSQGNRAVKAVNWLRDHYREPLKIDELAAVSAMAGSTFHRHFRDLTGLSPIQYQKRLRLHEARRVLLEGNCDIGSASLAVGYESSTQFIREYRRLFGEPPLKDVKALRGTGAGPQLL